MFLQVNNNYIQHALSLVCVDVVYKLLQIFVYIDEFIQKIRHIYSSFSTINVSSSMISYLSLKFMLLSRYVDHSLLTTRGMGLILAVSARSLKYVSWSFAIRWRLFPMSIPCSFLYCIKFSSSFSMCSFDGSWKWPVSVERKKRTWKNRKNRLGTMSTFLNKQNNNTIAFVLSEEDIFNEL